MIQPQTDDQKLSSFEIVTDYHSILDKIEQIHPVDYARTRNFVDGSVTKLSPYLSRGVISLKQVQETLLQKEYPTYQLERLFQELAWREYYQRVWQAKNDSIYEEIKHAQSDVMHHQMIAAVEQAATGIAAVDESIEKLYATGYMHNHVRMYVASITCNIAKAHWLQPSRWLYYHLLDGDLASNNCNWQWVAGAFAEKKYYCNQENINNYTGSHQQDTFMDHPYEEINLLPVPEILLATSTIPLPSNLPLTPAPVLDTTKPTLIYNSYNLDPLWRHNENANRVLLLEPSHFAKYPVSQKVIDFMIALSKNIAGIQLYCGEINDLQLLYQETTIPVSENFISKEHPAFTHYPGIKDEREWMYPNVTGYYASFFKFWKACKKSMRGQLNLHCND